MRLGKQHWRFSNGLALLAIVMQLVLAFGHIKLPGTLHQEGLLLRTLEQLVCATSSALHLSHDKTDHRDDGNSNCQICWLQSTAGSLTLPEGAAAIAAALYVLVAWQGLSDRFQTFALPLHYQVRDPPAPANV